jgi:hypothetical protein
VNVNTGIQSTSGKITLVGLVAAVLALVLPHTQNSQPTAEVIATTIVGGVTMIGTIAVKLWHDVQHRKIAASVGDLESIGTQLSKIVTAAVQTAGAAQAPPSGAPVPAPPPGG